jgi:hypothetical protein
MAKHVTPSEALDILRAHSGNFGRDKSGSGGGVLAPVPRVWGMRRILPLYCNSHGGGRLVKVCAPQ